MTSAGAISINQAAAALSGPWQRSDLAAANEAVLRVARFEGEFPWHDHEEDELFICWDGGFVIDLDGREPVSMSAGDLFVVPRGVRHRPVASEVAHVLLFERPETEQYGRQAQRASAIPRRQQDQRVQGGVNQEPSGRMPLRPTLVVTQAVTGSSVTLSARKLDPPGTTIRSPGPASLGCASKTARSRPLSTYSTSSRET
jgi:mannose-6-phosphate isomerase-like protein (cupin superfamily)